MGRCWNVYLLSHLCLRDSNKTHRLNCSCASSTSSYLTARPIGEVCAAPADTSSPVQSIYVSQQDTPPRPLTCLQVAQSHLSVGNFPGLFDDWPRAEGRWQIVGLMYLPPPCWQEAAAPSWSTGPHPISWALCLTRSGWGGFAYSLNETSMKMRGRPSLILADIGGLADEARSAFAQNWATFTQMCFWNAEHEMNYYPK